MAEVSIESIIKTSIITAFTITVALIWKDVITEIIELIIPSGSELFYKFIAAIIATLLVIVVIYIILETEYGAKKILKKLNNKK